MQDLKELLSILLSWPVASVISVLVLRRPINRLFDRLIRSENGEARIGPIEVRLGKLAEHGEQAVNQLERMNCLMAESRLLELEIVENNIGHNFTEDQRKKMKQHIDELRKLIKLCNNSGG